MDGLIVKSTNLVVKEWDSRATLIDTQIGALFCPSLQGNLMCMRGICFAPVGVKNGKGAILVGDDKYMEVHG